MRADPMQRAQHRQRRQTKRHGQRGAAMVEGIVVMTTMLVFLGMNVWAENVYGGKLDQAHSTRRDVLYYASHGCETQNGLDVDSYAQTQLAGLTGQEKASEADTPLPPPDAERDRRADLLNGTDFGGGGLTGAVERSWNSASGGKGSTPVLGSALVGRNSVLVSKTPLVARLVTKSWVTCNEKAYDNHWQAFVNFSLDFLKTLGGVP